MSSRRLSVCCRAADLLRSPRSLQSSPRSLLRSLRSLLGSPRSLLRSLRSLLGSPRFLQSSLRSLLSSPRSLQCSLRSLLRSLRSLLGSPRSLLGSPRSLLSSLSSVAAPFILRRLYRRVLPLRSALALVVVAVSLSACRRGEAFMHYEATDISGWERKDTLRLDVPPLETAAAYATTLHVRTTTSSRYPFTTLYVEVAQRWPDSCFVDTVKCTFANQETDATGIAVRQYTFPIRTLHRAAGDSAHITLRHVMRQTSVSGISDVGVSLAPH